MKAYNPLKEEKRFDIPRFTKKVNDDAKRFVSGGMHDTEYKEFINDMLKLLSFLGMVKKDILPGE